MEMNLTFITSLTCITRFLLFQEKINCHLTFLTLLTPHYQSYLFLSAVYQATNGPSLFQYILKNQKTAEKVV